MCIRDRCEYFALEGLTDLVNTIKQVHANLNADLQLSLIHI